MKKTIICIDRDGTLIHDSREHLFLGSDNNWHEKVKILPNAIEGVRRLNTIAGAGIYMITNQAGVAISDFPLLTEERAHEVCRFVVEMFKDRGTRLDGYFLCPHATPEYVSRKPGTNFHPHLVHDCHCLKPSLGMVFNALKAQGVPPDNADVYVIGDRASDVRTALNIGGTGILIPFVNEPGELDKVKRLGNRNRIHVAENLLAAAEYIVSHPDDVGSGDL
ncbi:MAG: HAD-IIIA family hydrolase [Desulfobulbaceae bacterium]|nr:HAD-IIIA family hydrolase [Desulfobulbaceae bacterium]